MSPSPPSRGEREGPAKREGEVGGAADWVFGPPHPALSPRPARGESKMGIPGSKFRQRAFEKGTRSGLPVFAAEVTTRFESGIHLALPSVCGGPDLALGG